MHINFAGLEDSALFVGMTPEEINVLSSVFHLKEIPEGKTVFVENMQGESLYLIQKGTIKISKMMAEGDEEVLIVLGPSDVFGEMALFDGAQRSATARVAEDVTLLSFSKIDFESLSEKNPALCLKLALNIIRLFSGRIRSSQAAHREMLIDALGRHH